MKQIACLTCILLLFFSALAQLQPIGNWREHLPYHQTIGVAVGNNLVYAATPYSIFSVEFSDNSLHRYSKVNGLSETGVNAIAFDPSTGKLIIGYSNSDIDVLKNDLVKNINALKLSPINGDKTIFNIYCVGGKAYLSTGIGIVVVDEDRYEVKETYVIGLNGQQVRVNALVSDKNFFYAATDEGVKTALLNSSNLSDYHNWQPEPINSGLGPGPIKSIATLMDDHPIALRSDTLFIKNGTQWNFYYSSGRIIRSISTSNNQLVIAEGTSPGSRIVILNSDGSVSKVIQNAANIKTPMQALTISSDVWIADSTGGLIKFSTNVFTPYTPNSPQSIALGEMFIDHNEVWASSGTVDINWVGQNNRNGLYYFLNNNWENFNSSNTPALDSLPDLVSLTRDLKNESVWASSFGGGLLQLKKDKTVAVYKQNSPLQSPAGRPGVYNVSGLAMDHENNLWIANYGAAQPLHVRKDDGSWRSFAIPFSIFENSVSQVMVDALDQKWIVSPKGNGLFCFNSGSSIDNPADDKWRYFRAGQGNGNLPDNNVLCIATDKNNFIWVGTINGIGIIPCTQEIFSNPACEAVLPVVQDGNFNGYLFHGEAVQTIAVDGADRKWIGTKNGVWLVSADGEKTIYHFTEAESPLLSNDVRRIAIDGTTGEVFFATSRGICSYRSTATEGSVGNKNVLVFPNPVPPGYSGQIAIRGLVDNAFVKITELDGRLVYQSRALGGQAIWNGKDYKGRRVASGVYLVLVTDDNRKENLATKIVFLH